MSAPDNTNIAGSAPEWATLQLQLRRLIKQTMHKYQEAYPTPQVGMSSTDTNGSVVTDACTILLPYLAYARWSGDAEVRNWLYQWRDAYIDVMRNNRSDFHHGFPVQAEAHHQWEDQSRFLSRLWFLDKNDPLNGYVVDDAAEHIGNWSPDVPPWYDWEKSDFRSYWFGTRDVAHRPGYPEDIWGDATPTPPTGIYREALYRVAQVALNAYFATGQERYLDWTRHFMDSYLQRLETMGANEDLVRIFATEGWPLPQYTDYFHKNGWPKPENRFVYGRYIPALLTDLYTITGEEKYKEGAQTFLDFCFPYVLEYWHQYYVLGSLLRYGLVTGDTRYEERLMQAIEAECTTRGDYISERYPFHENGVQALAFTRLRGPVAHSLQYWISGDEQHAVKALKQACGMAEVLLTRDSQEFIEGFATAQIGGIVDQHLVNPLLNLSGWRPGMQAHHLDVMDIAVSSADGVEGLPENVALLRTPAPLTERRFTLYNAGSVPYTLHLSAGSLRPTQIDSAPVNSAPVSLIASGVTLELLPGVPTTVAMTVSESGD